MLIDYLKFAWIGLIVFVIIRMLLPILGKFNYNEHSQLTDSEKKEFESLKSHNITLASFVIVVIAIILAFPQMTQHTQTVSQNTIQENIDSLLYFSIAMTCFFIASYFSLFRMNSLYLYIGETLETTGILSLGIGLILLVSKLSQNNLASIQYMLYF